MKPLIVVFLAIFIHSQSGHAQHPNNLSADKIISNYKDDTDILKTIKTKNLSILWTTTPNRAIVGFIGNNYSRFQIVFTTVTHTSPESTDYRVTGFTRKWDTIRYFSGDMILTHAWYCDLPDTIREGILTGTYEFSEATNKLFASGYLRGNFISYWYVDTKDSIYYDDLNTGDDSYNNNLFIGIWEAYRGKRKSTCNWGDYRIPNCDSLDVGVGEFAPDNAYLKYGWEGFSGTFFDSPLDTTHEEDSIKSQEKADQWWPKK